VAVSAYAEKLAGVAMTPPVKRIKITWRDGAYYVSEPAWDGGEVVPASDYDALAAQMAGLRADAERYRWLSVHANKGIGGGWAEFSFKTTLPKPFVYSVEELLDAAMAAALPAPPAATTVKP
jgi:hypothetical protein